jgi:hypothetical protein
VVKKCIEFFSVKLDVVRNAASESKAMQGSIQLEASRTFRELSGGPIEKLIDFRDIDVSSLSSSLALSLSLT